MAVISGHCRVCGAVTAIMVGQAAKGDELVWHASYTCPSCGAQGEEDSRGTHPDEVRHAILRQDGGWALHLDEPGRQVTVATKLLRQALNLSLAEVGKLRVQILVAAATGTRTEMERPQTRFASRTSYR